MNLGNKERCLEQTKNSRFVFYFLSPSPLSVPAGYSLPLRWEHRVGGGEATRAG